MEQENSLSREQEKLRKEEDFIRNATIEMNTRNETLNHLELQRKRINKRTKRNEKKLEKRIEDFESAKYSWIENRYSYVCGKKWNQMRNIDMMYLQ